MNSGFVRFASAVLVAMAAVTVFAGFFAPYDPLEQDRLHPYAPPTRVHFLGHDGRFHLRPFIYGWREPSPGHYEEDPGLIEPVRWFVRGARYRVLNLFSSERHLFGVNGSQRVALLGTDAYGRDQLSRWLFGGQVSLLAGVVATGVALSLGLVVGVIAGYFGKVTDSILMRLAELFLAVPWLYLLLALRAFLPLRVSPVQAFVAVVLVIGAVGWARPARIVRGVARSARAQDYVTAGRSAGAGHLFLIVHHILPQTAGVVFTQAALLVPQYILAEMTLSFFGLGVSEPVASWGNLLQSLQQYHVLMSYWWMLIPAVALIPIFWAFTVLADQARKRVEFPA